MSKAYDILKECDTFYVLTNGDHPAGRTNKTITCTKKIKQIWIGRKPIV